MVGRCLIIYFISKHAHVHSDLISVAEIKYRFYIYRIYFWTAEEAYCMKITCPLHLPVQCHSEYNPTMLWHWHGVQQCSMSPPWSTCHHGPHCMSKLGAMVAPVPDCGGRWRGLEQIVTTALGLVLPRWRSTLLLFLGRREKAVICHFSRFFLVLVISYGLSNGYKRASSYKIVDSVALWWYLWHKLWPAPDMTARISAHWSHSAGGWGHGGAAPRHCGLIDNQAGVLNTEYWL